MNRSDLVFFPYMHPEFIPDRIRGKAVLLNPGTGQGLADTYTPEGYLLDPDGALRRLHEFYAFGEQFSNPRDMEYYAVQGFEDFYSETTMAIKSELTGGGPSAEDEARQQCLQMQHMLILGFALEERILDMGKFGAEALKARKKFEDSLGLDDEDRDFESFADLDMSARMHGIMHWQRLFSPFAYFLSQSKAVVVWEEEVVQELKSAAQDPETAEMDLPGLDEFGPEVFQVPVSAFAPELPDKERLRCVCLNHI